MIKTWAVTDTGLVRKENQDTYRIARNGDICVVCDGMGGAAGGQEASRIAVFTFMEEMRRYTNEKKADFWLMGEVIHGDYARWANADV